MKRNNPVWRVIRFLTLVIVGLINTVFIRPEDIGTFKNYIGYLLIIMALIDIIIFVIGWKKNQSSHSKVE